MNQADFRPEIWTAPGFPDMLVCGHRWLRGAQVTGAAVPTTFETIRHAVTIQLDPATVCFNFDGGDGLTWTRHKPELHGISARCGALALAEGWRCVDLKIDPFNFHAEGKHDARKLLDFRGGVILRNIGIFLAWDRWNRERLGMAARLAEVCRWGYECTPDALRRVVEKAGLTAKT
jgi:hypothetical protein